ncbi:unnamed protein product [Adineta steineri]|uniref:Uncharacterized protein n=1 Tax=Adineta steineri TaxID=433720 RepID=A0A813YFA3_9BILA|nr:unnamed protein product [Adineta steineri]CAF0883477.1 unnamed protein product [Adineta steineri]CAF0886948.1 unnamed protein product [Adineta steineri]
MFICVLMSVGNLYGYPSESFNEPIINYSYGLDDLHYQQLANNEHYLKLLNMNDDKQLLLPYMNYIHKRLIDF